MVIYIYIYSCWLLGLLKDRMIWSKLTFCSLLIYNKTFLSLNPYGMIGMHPSGSCKTGSQILIRGWFLAKHYAFSVMLRTCFAKSFCFKVETDGCRFFMWPTSIFPPVSTLLPSPWLPMAYSSYCSKPVLLVTVWGPSSFDLLFPSSYCVMRNLFKFNLPFLVDSM